MVGAGDGQPSAGESAQPVAQRIIEEIHRIDRKDSRPFQLLPEALHQGSMNLALGDPRVLICDDGLQLQRRLRAVGELTQERRHPTQHRCRVLAYPHPVVQVEVHHRPSRRRRRRRAQERQRIVAG